MCTHTYRYISTGREGACPALVNIMSVKSSKILGIGLVLRVTSDEFLKMKCYI